MIRVRGLEFFVLGVHLDYLISFVGLSYQNIHPLG